MHVQILGTGCAKCHALEAATLDALTELGVEVDVEHVTDPGEIASWGVMSTPALVVDDEVVAGRVPTSEEVRALLVGRPR